MWGKIAGVIFWAAVFQYYMKMRIWLDWDKQFTYRHAPGPCTQVLKDGGSEDMAHIGNGVILISSGFGFAGTNRGKLLMMNVNKGSMPLELNLTNTPSAPNFMANPHGISTWKDEKTGSVLLSKSDSDDMFVYKGSLTLAMGVVTLYVITHPPDQDRVEVFELQKPPSLKHIKTITDRKFGNMNDLVVVGKDKFYITQFLQSREYNKALYEIWLFSHIKYMGKVFYYDGEKAREVASDWFVPNGINISPDKSTVYVAEFGRDHVLGYQMKPNNDLVEIWSYDMGCSVDNIQVDPVTGDLWLGCQPQMKAAMDVYGWFGFAHSSQVLKVEMKSNMVSQVIDVYSDPDGTEAFGCSVATYVEGKLIIGTVNHQTVVCDSKYVM